MRILAIRIPLSPGSHDDVSEILREGPPFDLDVTSFERHLVFHIGDELVFVFEGVHSDQAVADLVASRPVQERLLRLARFVAGTPAVAEEAFAWEHRSSPDGLSFGPLPGPGDSDGGPVDL